MFAFQVASHRTRVLDSGPWNFRGFLLVPRPWSPRDSISHMDFFSCDFWMQIHGLPFERLSSANASLIGESIGSVVDVDTSVDEDAACADFLRVKVVMAVANPYSPGFPFSVDGSSPLWILFKYERLSGICVVCGCIDHLASACDAPDPHQLHHLLGPSMKAFPPRSPGNLPTFRSSANAPPQWQNQDSI